MSHDPGQIPVDSVTEALLLGNVAIDGPGPLQKSSNPANDNSTRSGWGLPYY